MASPFQKSANGTLQSDSQDSAADISLTTPVQADNCRDPITSPSFWDPSTRNLPNPLSNPPTPTSCRMVELTFPNRTLADLLRRSRYHHHNPQGMCKVDVFCHITRYFVPLHLHEPGWYRFEHHVRPGRDKIVNFEGQEVEIAPLWVVIKCGSVGFATLCRCGVVDRCMYGPFLINEFAHFGCVVTDYA